MLVAAPSVELLRDSDVTVHQATTGPDALALLEGETVIDVLIVDIGLPGMNGNDVIRAARAIAPQLKIIVATGYDSSAIDVPADARTRILSKPYLPTDLLTAVQQLAELPD